MCKTCDALISLSCVWCQLEKCCHVKLTRNTLTIAAYTFNVTMSALSLGSILHNKCQHLAHKQLLAHLVKSGDVTGYSDRTLTDMLHASISFTWNTLTKVQDVC